jgi:hypothetical protein
MKWVNPPERVRRFGVHQIVLHWAAVAAGGAALATAVLASLPGGEGWRGPHVHAGTVAALFLAYHVAALLGTGIRYNISVEKVAFLPAGREWRALRGEEGKGPGPEGKYSPREKGDYLNILAWSLALAVTGLVLRWPGRVGVPGMPAFFWIKTLHAGCGAAWAAHILVYHVPGRWLRSTPGMRRAILTGWVPFEEASRREGWTADLVSAGVLVPAAEEKLPEDSRESQRVRDLLEAGNRLAREGKYGEACAAFEEAVALFPGYSQARFNLAVARMKEGRNDLAAEQFRIFMETDPFNPMSARAKELLDGLTGREGEKVR